MAILSRRSFNALLATSAIAASGVARAQNLPTIKVSSLTLPVIAPLVWNVMKARGFDTKHGFQIDPKPYPSISAYYAGFATGETDAVIGGPTVFQKLYQEGVPARIIGTGFTLSDLVIFVKDEKIKTFADLKGRQLAADMGSGQFQVVKMYAGEKGIDLGKDITIVNANFAVARAQLEADRVDAAMVIEPLASIILKQNPNWRIVFNGATAWKEITGAAGWELVPAMRADAIQRMPNAPKMLLAAMADVADVMNKETDAADRIAVDTVKLPPGILKAAVSGQRLNMEVHPMSNAAVRKSVLDMMQRAVKAGFYDKAPDEKIFHVS